MRAGIPGEVTGPRPMFNACAVSAAATVRWRSLSRVPLPVICWKLSTNAGCQAMTSRITSARSTLGIIASTMVRSSVNVAGSGIASILAVCNLPSAMVSGSIVSAA